MNPNGLSKMNVMNKIFFLSIFIFFIFLSGCAVQHKSLTGIRNWSYPQHQMDSTITFSFVDDVLEKSGNVRQAKWADRKDIKIIGIKLINNTTKPIHGTQVSFVLNDEKVELIHNKWLAKKVRQRVSPALILAVPFFMIEELLFHRHDDEDEYYYHDDSEPVYLTKEVVEQEEAYRKKSNFNLREGLISFQLASKVLLPGRPVYGIVGFKTGQDLEDLKVEVNQTSENLF